MTIRRLCFGSSQHEAWVERGADFDNPRAW